MDSLPDALAVVLGLLQDVEAAVVKLGAVPVLPLLRYVGVNFPAQQPGVAAVVIAEQVGPLDEDVAAPAPVGDVYG